MSPKPRRVRARNPFKIIISIAFVLLLLGGAGFGWYYQQQRQVTLTTAAITATSRAHQTIREATTATALALHNDQRSTATAAAADLERRYQTALALQQATSYEQARGQLQELIALQPNYKDAGERLKQVNEALAEAQYQQGVAAAEQHLWNDAITAFDKTLQIVPNYKDATVRRATAVRALNITPTIPPTLTATPTATPTSTATATPTTFANVPTAEPITEPTSTPTAEPSPTDTTGVTTLATPTPAEAETTIPDGIPSNDDLVGSGVQMEQPDGATGLRVVLLGPNGQPWQNQYIEVLAQRDDASGNPTYGDRITGGSINQQGQVDFEIGPGTYVVCAGNVQGYGWTEQGCVYNVQIAANHTTIIRLQAGMLQVAVVNAADDPWENVYSGIYTQKNDVAGTPITDNRVSSGATDNTGIISYWLTPGLYAVTMDLPGYNWGRLSETKGDINAVVRAGRTTQILIHLGQLQVGLKQVSGEPATNVYFSVYTQKPDINGRPTLSDRVWSGATDNGGLASIDLTQGNYAIQMKDTVLYDIPIEWGRTTTSDGQTATFK